MSGYMHFGAKLIEAVLSSFGAIAKRIQRRRLRRMMRGYRCLRETGRLGRIADIKQAMTTRMLDISETQISPYIMGASAPVGEIVVRQYLLVRIGGANLNRALLSAAGKNGARVIYAMPSEWCDIVCQHGFEVDRLSSIMLWRLYAFALLFYGVLKSAKTALAIAKANRSSHGRFKPYAYFADLTPGNLPQDLQGKSSHNIVSWYMQWNGRKSCIEAIHHGVASSVCKILGKNDLVFRRSPLPELSSINELARYIFWAVCATACSVFDLLRGRWWHPLLLNQAALAAQARIVQPDLLAKEYLFHNSNWIYRPLWTYEAERAGSSILFYFYSTNAQAFNNISRCLPPPYGWKAASWPRYLVWDQYQADFIREAIGNLVEVSVVGEIWFSDDESVVPAFTNPVVAVFDVQPFRDSKYQLLGLGYEYYIPKTSIRFLQDIQSVLKEFNVDMAFKRKREIGRVAHPRYRSYVKSINEFDNVVSIPSEVSASRLIESCFAVISMPFTSTALLGEYQGKPSAYYDPCAGVVKDDCAAHGIEVLIGKDELRAWLRAAISKSGAVVGQATQSAHQ